MVNYTNGQDAYVCYIEWTIKIFCVKYILLKRTSLSFITRLLFSLLMQIKLPDMQRKEKENHCNAQEQHVTYLGLIAVRGGLS